MNRTVLARVASACALFLCASPVWAVDFSQLMINLAKPIGPLTGLAFMISFVIGFIFIFRGIGLFKKFGMQHNMMNPGEVAGPLMFVFVGTVLMYLPYTADVSIKTIFGENSTLLFYGTTGLTQQQRYERLGSGEELLSFTTVSFQDQWVTLANTVVLYIQFIGIIAFIKGWVIMAKSGNPGVQPGSISKGITHIVGGIIAVNFVTAVDVIRETLTA